MTVDEALDHVSGGLIVPGVAEALAAEVRRLRKYGCYAETISSHWSDCWKAVGHHECAIRRVEELEGEVSRLQDVAQKYGEALIDIEDITQSSEARAEDKWEVINIMKEIGLQPTESPSGDATMATITITDCGMDIPESHCSECDMRFNLCWSRNPVYEKPGFCPFCGEEIKDVIDQTEDEDS